MKYIFLFIALSNYMFAFLTFSKNVISWYTHLTQNKSKHLDFWTEYLIFLLGSIFLMIYFYMS